MRDALRLPTPLEAEHRMERKAVAEPTRLDGRVVNVDGLPIRGTPVSLVEQTEVALRLREGRHLLVERDALCLRPHGHPFIRRRGGRVVVERQPLGLERARDHQMRYAVAVVDWSA